MGPVGLRGCRTIGRLTGPGGGRFTRQEYGASRSRRLQEQREANRSMRRQVHKAGVLASRSRRLQDHREANRSWRWQVHKAGVWGQ